MSTLILIHLEPAKGEGAVWWAESPSIPGLSVAADSLADLYALTIEALAQIPGPEVRGSVRFDLAPEAPSSAGDAVSVTVNLRDNRPYATAGRSGATAGPDVRRSVLVEAVA